MSATILEKQIETYKAKIKIMEHSITASAGAYYNINITKNVVPGTMYQVIDDVEYSINEKIGLPKDCKYWDVIEYWGNQLSQEQQAAFEAGMNGFVAKPINIEQLMNTLANVLRSNKC